VSRKTRVDFTAGGRFDIQFEMSKDDVAVTLRNELKSRDRKIANRAIHGGAIQPLDSGADVGVMLSTREFPW
jgi:hypothetical protein